MTTPIQFITPVALLDVVERLGPAFERETGYTLDLAVMLNPQVPSFIKGGASWSLAASNPEHLEELDTAVRGPVVSIGRSPLAFGALGHGVHPAHDDAAISAVLRSGNRIGYTGAGTSGGTFKRLIDHLGLTQDLQDKLIPLAGGEPMRQLLAGTVDLAALPLTNIAPIEGVQPLAFCPWSMDVHIDLAMCLHPNACAGAHAFAAWLMSAERDDALAQLGLMRL
ncbi:MAG: substrate-binding domain-containing protein [Pseudomonadota bacterium]